MDGRCASLWTSARPPYAIWYAWRLVKISPA
ncbi:Hypothetical Protein XCAW_01779 [Xanthomonas citri subsp. citri Aw12879]|nr:Hypothetical Protein XCAW_01779 [Xanthomonas citri subsp. citri Aw12879]